ncbi:MAG: nuclear transport factor 2 family protein [Candidatus Kariarchaeaceae archaeon]
MVVLDFLSIADQDINNTGVKMKEKHKVLAEQFFRGVYGGDPSVVDTLASDDIVLSYPIFKKLFNSPSIRGRQAVKEFATGFGNRWTDTLITIHEVIAEGDRVVLVWSFKARNVGSEKQDDVDNSQEHSWGGITLFRFNKSGKIVAEIGEESEPGPIERVTTNNLH